MNMFEFEYREICPIEAENLNDALKQFQKQHSDTHENLYAVRYNGKTLPYEYSRETGEKIYYIPGCRCGKTGCIFDPMSDIARSCTHQSDMTPDKWKSCSEDVPEGCDCPYYDDEDR